jgi:tetratricopeptide (TPR) repeat protein
MAGWERDQAALATDPEARRANFEAYLAYAERRWEDMIAAINRAERGFAFEPRAASMLRGFGYQELGQVDSAIASFERFLDTPDPLPSLDGAFRSDAMQRLGELYEAKGDRQKAIEYYSQFTALWANADAELQPRVREIRDRIARLQQEIG